MINLARFIASISVIPVGTGSTSLSPLIAEVIKVFRKEGIKFELTPMATIIHSDSLDEVFHAIRRAHDTLLSLGTKRIIIYVNIDARHDKPARTPKDKVKAILEKL